MKLKRRRRAIRLKFVSNSGETKNEKLINSVIGIWLASMFFAGFGGVFISMFSIPVLWYLPLFTGIAAIAVVFLVDDFDVKKKLIISSAAAAVLLVLWLIFSKYFKAGLYIVINNVNALIDVQSFKISSQYEVLVAEGLYPACAALFLTPAAALFGVLCGFIVSRSQRFLSAVLIACAAVAVVLISAEHAGIWSALIFVSAMLLICRSLVCDNDIGGAGTIVAVICVVLAAGCLMGAGFMAVIPGSFSQKLEKNLQDTRDNIYSTAHKVRYETETYPIMPEGNFFNIAEEYILSYEKTLEITMSKPESVYLRGYVGEKYTDLGWRDIDKTDMVKYTGLFYQLHKNGFHPQTQLANIASILDDEISAEQAIEVSVENEGACRHFIYAPYEVFGVSQSLLPSDKMLSRGLYSGGFNGQTEYSYKMLSNQVGRAHQLAKMLEKQLDSPSDKLKDYLAMEAKYRSFVYENYTEISQEDSDLLKNYIGEPGQAGHTHIPYDDAKNNILLVLGRQLEYEEDMTPYDGEVGFLRYVLRKEQCGNSPHYATVATMMLRHYGIPARYVEGYVITPDDADAAEDGEIILTDGNAHAWTEYYHDGLGWIPFETDPMFIGVMEGVSAPPQYMQSGGGGGEEEQPEFDRDRDRNKDKDLDADKVVKLVMPWVLLLIAVVTLIAYWLLRRKKTLGDLDAECRHHDGRKAVCAMMLHMRKLLEYCEITDSIDSPKGLIIAVGKAWGEQWQSDFGMAMITYMKASFGGRKIEDHEREQVAKTVKSMVEKVDSLQNRRGRFKAKYIKFLY